MHHISPQQTYIPSCRYTSSIRYYGQQPIQYFLTPPNKPWSYHHQTYIFFSKFLIWFSSLFSLLCFCKHILAFTSFTTHLVYTFSIFLYHISHLSFVFFPFSCLFWFKLHHRVQFDLVTPNNSFFLSLLGYSLSFFPFFLFLFSLLSHAHVHATTDCISVWVCIQACIQF